MTWTQEDLQRDAYLGGRLHLWQPKKGYRAGIDAVLLAASVPAREGQSVLDLGCGVGAAALCLHTRVAGLTLAGLELQASYADMAIRNATQTGASFEVFEGCIADPPAELRAQSFDHVIANPPFYDRTRGSRAPEVAREMALGGNVDLADWFTLAAKRLKPKGYLHMILKADRLDDALTALAGRLGSVEVLPLAPRAEKPAALILVRARKEGRAPLVLHAPVILHTGDVHPGDRDHYSPRIASVLREGAALAF